MLNIKRDGHIHSPYCPHGTKDSFEMYVEQALKIGLEEMTFTEHMPFRDIFIEDKAFLDECALQVEDVSNYIKDAKAIKHKYKNKIKINIGFEVDYVEGYEEGTEELLNKYGSEIEDSILSVHFVKYDNKYYAIDMLSDFELLLDKVGSLEEVYNLYFNTVLKSIRADLGKYKPKRIGHPTLIRIFNNKYPFEYNNVELIKLIIDEINNRGYELDLNTAGLRKPYCGETYPSGLFMSIAEESNIRFVYGSDSHKSDDVGKDFK